MGPKEFDEFCGSITRLNHLIGVVDIIDQSFYEKHPEYKDKQMGKVVDFWMVGVLPEYTGLGLSKVLTEKCKELVSGKFEYAVMECTGHFSQRMATKSGFNCIRSYKYSEHL